MMGGSLSEFASKRSVGGISATLARVERVSPKSKREDEVDIYDAKSNEVTHVSNQVALEKEETHVSSL